MTLANCPFCLADSGSDGEIVLRGEYLYVLTNPDPVLTASLMLIPFRHVETPFELSREEWLESRTLLQQAKTLLDKRGAQGYSVGWNVGEVAGQTVPHVHMHIIARFDDEPLVGKGIRHHLKQLENKRLSAREE